MKKLQLTFRAKSGKKNNLSLNYVKENLDSATTKTAMEKILSSNLFQKDGIQLFEEIVGAKYIERTENPVLD